MTPEEIVSPCDQIIDCKFNHVFREAIFTEMINGACFSEKEVPQKPEYEIKTYFDIWVPENTAGCQKLEMDKLEKWLQK